MCYLQLKVEDNIKTAFLKIWVKNKIQTVTQITMLYSHNTLLHLQHVYVQYILAVINLTNISYLILL